VPDFLSCGSKPEVVVNRILVWKLLTIAHKNPQLLLEAV
jgi:hypothetical protein